MTQKTEDKWYWVYEKGGVHVVPFEEGQSTDHMPDNKMKLQAKNPYAALLLYKTNRKIDSWRSAK